MQIFGLFGMFSAALGSGLLIYLAYVRLILLEPIGDRPLVLLAVLLVILGVQFIGLGLMGELIVRTYYESQHKPIYVIREELNGDE